VTGLVSSVVLSAVAAAAPTESEVGPGLVGFLATFAVVLATVLLMFDLVRRLRRLRYRAEQAASSERLGDEQRVVDDGAVRAAHTGMSADDPGHSAGTTVEPEARDEQNR